MYACSVGQSCPALCHSMDCSPSGSSVHEIFQASILERVAISYPGDLPDPATEPVSFESPALGSFTTGPPGNPRSVLLFSR